MFLDIQPTISLIILNRYPFHVSLYISNNVVQIVPCYILFYPWLISVLNIHDQLTMHCPNPAVQLQPPCQYSVISLYILSYPLTFQTEKKLQSSGIEPSTLRILPSRLDYYTTIVDVYKSLLVYWCQQRIQPAQSISGAGAANDVSRCHRCNGPGAGDAAGPGAGGGRTWGRRGNKTQWLTPWMCRTCNRRSRSSWAPRQAGRGEHQIEFPAGSMAGMISNLIQSYPELLWTIHPSISIYLYFIDKLKRGRYSALWKRHAGRVCARAHAICAGVAVSSSPAFPCSLIWDFFSTLLLSPLWLSNVFLSMLSLKKICLAVRVMASCPLAPLLRGFLGGSSCCMRVEDICLSIRFMPVLLGGSVIQVIRTPFISADTVAPSFPFWSMITAATTGTTPHVQRPSVTHCRCMCFAP